MFKNVRIKTLITSTIGLLLCFILLLGIISLYYIKTLSQTTQTLYDKPHTNLVTMYQLKSSVLQASDNLKEAYFNKKKVDNSTENIINSISDFLNILETNKVDPKAPRSANMGALMQASEQWSSSAKQFLNYLNNGNTVEAMKAYRICNDLEKGVLENLNGIIETASTNAAKFKADAMSNSWHSFIVMIIFCIFVFIVAIIALGITLKSIHHPMNIILNSAKKISEGNLDFEIEYDSKNEFGELASDFKIMKNYLKQMVKDIDNSLYEIGQGNFDFKNHMEYVGNFTPIYDSIQKICKELSHTIYSIHCTSDQVASGSGQMSAGAQALAQGATEQASSIEELCRKIRAITNQIEENTGNAEKVNDCVHETSEQAEASKQKMETMIKAMSEISDKADKIEHIIKTIEDIAFQTNILALNAAVEAARAGQAGKGFAVVADEVRNLASKSADAAHDTTALISETIQSVENGNAIADETAHSLLAMVEATHQVSSIVKGMSSAFKEQEEAAEKVMEGIEQISSVVQTNSATAEESAAASEQLFSQATVLKDMAAKFHLKEV